MTSKASVTGNVSDNKSDSQDLNKKEAGNQKRGINDQKSEKNKKKTRYSNLGNLTPHNDTSERIFLTTKETAHYPDPPRMKVRGKNAKNGKFCRFHNQLGHDTNECRDLQIMIEELIKKNQLQKYVKRDNAPTYLIDC